MEIDVNEDKKHVTIWLTNEEKRDAALRERLKPLYQRYKAQNFLVAVFESGEQNLEDLTGGLLVHNRKRAAAREVQQEKGIGMTLSM